MGEEKKLGAVTAGHVVSAENMLPSPHVVTHEYSSDYRRTVGAEGHCSTWSPDHYVFDHGLLATVLADALKWRDKSHAVLSSEELRDLSIAIQRKEDEPLIDAARRVVAERNHLKDRLDGVCEALGCEGGEVYDAARRLVEERNVAQVRLAKIGAALSASKANEQLQRTIEEIRGDEPPPGPDGDTAKANSSLLEYIASKKIVRAGRKTPDPTEDLTKAIRCIERFIEVHENGEVSK